MKNKNYKIVYLMFKKTFLVLYSQAINNDSVNDIYYNLKKYLEIAFEKCSKDNLYCDKWLLWFNKQQSTLLLRELFSDVKCNYFDSLINSNSIDTLDSLQYKIQ